MKKTFFFIIVLIPTILYSDPKELLYSILIEDSPYFEFFNGELAGILKDGEKILLEGTVSYGGLQPNDAVDTLGVWFFQGGKDYITYVRKMVPATTENLFSSDIIDDNTKNTFLPLFFCDIFSVQNREQLLVYEPHVFRLTGEEYPVGKMVYWYERYDPLWDECRFFNSVLQLDPGMFLLIKEITKTSNGYEIICIESDSNWKRENKNHVYNWQYIPAKESFTLIVVFDGDYLDLYVNNLAQKLATLIRADEEFVIQFNKLIKTNSCDLSNVQWPRRADGGMDYPPPGMSDYRATHITTDRLRLRKAPDISAQTVVTLEKGAEVQVLETGEEAVVDGIRAPWVKVLDGTRQEGWCFSGYLREIQHAVSAPGVMEPVVEPAVSIEGASESTEPETMAVEQPAAAIPLAAALAVTGIVLAAGFVAAYLLRRKGSR